ncbi:MAG: hypothetical protein WKF74_09930 [Pyrinomonadaceae bacterium]
MREPSWLVRVIEYFSNETDELLGEFALPQVEIAELQRIWNAPPDEPMVECFSIEEEQAQFFRELAGVEFDFARYSYFLAAYTTDWEAPKREGGYMGLFPPPKELPAFPEARRVMPKSVS